MATDVEESDTDDHERPAPPKRQRTRLLQGSESCWDAEEEPTENCEEKEEADEYDNAERHAREKLKTWQACQVARGFVDNTINRILEDYIMAQASSYPLEDARFRLVRGNDMEDTAVMMAIRNHGLVQSTGLVSRSNAFDSDKAPGYWTNSAYADVNCSCPSNSTVERSNSLKSNNLGKEEFGTLDWDADKADESNQEENFLERAVIEAIKKKGLSALSVDYG